MQTGGAAVVNHLGLAVAVVAAVAAAVGVGNGGGHWLGLDPTLLALAGAGAVLVAVVRLSRGISPFLRVFSAVFAAEYAVTGLGYIAVHLHWWPEAWAQAAPPASLPLTVATFGLLVYLVSLVPVIRQITRLTDPYFANPDCDVVEVAGLGARPVRERRFAAGLIVALVVVNQLQVGMNVRLSYFNRDWFNAIQNKDSAAFWSLLFGVFCVWAAAYVVSHLVEYGIESVLKIRWRRWLTERYCALWLDGGSPYRAALVGQGADNPDQRIAEDVRSFIESTYAYSISLLSTVTSLVSFSIILWTIPAEFTIPGTSIAVPGLPFWVALGYSIIGTWLTHVIGKALVRLDFQRERYEADFRFALARIREYSEQIALLHGEAVEKQLLGGRFGAIVGNFYAIVARTVKLLMFTTTYFQINAVVPYIIVAPYFFLGKITLGLMTQTAGAFGRVESALTFFVARYQSLASYKAVVDRLTTFGSAIDAARSLGTQPPRIERVGHDGRDLAVTELVLGLPDGREIVRIDRLVFTAGTTSLLSGPSGSGKSTLFRAISGIWPYGAGTIAQPAGASVMLLPQRPYVPAGTLKTALAYPSLADEHDDEAVRDALRLVRLPGLVDDLGTVDNWLQRLSGGEQQRVAIARALLNKPDWLLLDEATAALDEALEAELYRMLYQALPGTTIVSIGHRSTLVGLHHRHIEMTAQADGTFAPRPALATPEAAVTV